MEHSEWLSCEDVAKLEKKSLRAIQNRCAKGTLPCKKEGKEWKINKKQYEKMWRKELLIPVGPQAMEQDGSLKNTLIFSNNKGGVGKTTTAIMVCDKLAKLGYRVLLVDMDGQGNSTSLAGLRAYKGSNKPGRNEYRYAIVDVLLGEIHKLFNKPPTIKIEQAIYRARDFYVLPCDDRIDRFKNWLLDNAQSFTSVDDIYNIWKNHFPRLLTYALKNVQNSFDFIVIDTPPSLEWATQSALIAGTDVVIPIELGRFEINGLNRVFKFITECTKYNSGLGILGIVITRYGPHVSNLDKDLEEGLRNHPQFGPLLFDTVILRSLLVREATLKTESFFDYWRKGLPRTAVESLEDFAEELIMKLINSKIKTGQGVK